jgi:hypothetical protein
MAGDDGGVIQEPWLVMMGVLFRNHGWWWWGCYSGTVAGDDGGVIQEPWLMKLHNRYKWNRCTL